MLYSFEYPPTVERQFRNEAKISGEELPKRMQNPPQLFLGLALYLNAWHELDGERDRNKLEPIRRTIAFQYADDYGFDFLQREELWQYVQKMDREFLAWWKTKLPKETKTPPVKRKR